MARFQTNQVKGIVQVPTPLSAGVVLCARFDFTFTAAFTAASDQLELGILPAFCTVRDAILIGSTAATAAVDIGLMAGTVGDSLTNNAGRAVGDQFFDGQDANDTFTRMSKLAGFAVPPVAYDRSIGLISAANIAAGASAVSLLLFYSA